MGPVSHTLQPDVSQWQTVGTVAKGISTHGCTLWPVDLRLPFIYYVCLLGEVPDHITLLLSLGRVVPMSLWCVLYFASRRSSIIFFFSFILLFSVFFVFLLSYYSVYSLFFLQIPDWCRLRNVLYEVFPNIQTFGTYNLSSNTRFHVIADCIMIGTGVLQLQVSVSLSVGAKMQVIVVVVKLEFQVTNWRSVWIFDTRGFCQLRLIAKKYCHGA